jgi:hypothetical protein
MEEPALKVDLIDKIEHADFNQLRELYGLITNYFNGNQSTEEWDLLPESHKRQITKGLKEANAGLGIPAKEVSKRLREKYKSDC